MQQIMVKIILLFGFLTGSYLMALPAYAASKQSETTNLAKKFYWDGRARGCFTNENNYATRNPDKCVPPANWPDYQESRKRIKHLFFHSQDLELIQMAENDIAFSEKRYATGEYYFESWIDYLYYFFNSSYFYEPPDNNPKVNLLNGWIDYQNGQGYSIIAKAMALYGKATIKFNYEYPRENSPETLVNYAKSLMDANTVLDGASTKIKNTAAWYEYKLKIAYQHPQLKSTREKLLNEAIEAWPDYPPIYAIAYAFSNPKWGGSYKKMDEVARLAVEKSKKRLGAAMYPQIIFKATIYYVGFEIPYHEIDWDLMKQGFRDYQKYLGGNSSMFYWFVSTACKMGDREEARRLFPIYEEIANGDIDQSVNACREFAFSEEKEQQNLLSQPVMKPSI